MGAAACHQEPEKIQVPVQLHVPAEPDPFTGLTTLRASVIRGGGVVATVDTPATETRIEIPGVEKEGGVFTIQLEGLDASGTVLARGRTRSVDPYEPSPAPYGLMFLRVGVFSRLEAALPVNAAGVGVVSRTQSAYLFGGDAGSGPLADVWAYDLDSAKISSLAQMGEARANPAGVVLSDGRLLVLGGSDGGGLPLKTTEIYDPVSVTWSPGPTLQYARIGPQAFLLDADRVLVVGAMDSPVPAEIVDAGAGTSTDVSGSTPRQVPAAVRRTDGSVLVAGGFDGSDELISTEVISASGVMTASLPSGLRVPRLGAAAALASDGNVLVVGGQRGPAFASERYISSAEWVDAGGLTAGLAGDRLARRRAYEGALAVEDGILVMGGSNGASVDGAEWFDGNHFVDAGSPIRTRSFPTLSVLGDGTALVAGGGNAGLEVFQPGPLPDLAARVDLQVRTTIPPTPSPDPFSGATTAIYTVFDAAGPIAEIEIDPGTAPAPGTNAQPGPFAVFDGFRIAGDIAARVEAVDSGGTVLARGGNVQVVPTTQYETGNLVLYMGRVEAWSVAAGTMASPREQGEVAVLPNGRLLVIGGTGTGTDTAEPFDPSAAVFDPALSAGTARSVVRAAQLDDGSVLVTGTGGAGTTATDVFDPLTGAFAPGDTLTDARSFHSLTRMADGRVVAIGGRTGGGEAAPVVGTAEVWDSGAWGAPIAMVEPRQRHNAALRGDGVVVVAGGQRIVQVQASPMGSDSPPPPVPSPEVIALTELFDGSSFSPGPDLNDLRRDHAMIALPDGGVMVCGGVDFAAQQGPGNNLDTCETLAMGGGAWQAEIALQSARDDLVMLLLHDGRVLAVGGSNGGTAVSDVDVVWTMDGDTPAPGPALNLPRALHMGAVLPDGRAVVLGGHGPGGGGLDTAEVFTPASWSTPFGY